MNDFYTIGQITTDCRKLIEIAETERQTADTTREKFLSGALYAFRAMLRLLELVPEEKFQNTKREVNSMDDTIRPLEIFDKGMRSFTTEEIIQIHKGLFEMTEQLGISDLLYSGDRQTSLNKALDRFQLYVNQILVERLLQEKGVS